MKCCDNKNNKETKKNPEKVEGMLCYCFHYTEQQFIDAHQIKREMTLIEEIKSKMKDPGCFCESSNPSGKCCLGDITKFIEKLTKLK